MKKKEIQEEEGENEKSDKNNFEENSEVSKVIQNVLFEDEVEGQVQNEDMLQNVSEEEVDVQDAAGNLEYAREDDPPKFRFGEDLVRFSHPKKRDHWWNFHHGYTVKLVK